MERRRHFSIFFLSVCIRARTIKHKNMTHIINIGYFYNRKVAYDSITWYFGCFSETNLFRIVPAEEVGNHSIVQNSKYEKLII